jgi:Uma2 family endonuclease
LPEYGGQSKNTYDDYIVGAPELVAEIANSSKSIDLHLKLKRYEKFGVHEYLVYCLNPQQLHFFNLQSKPRKDLVISNGIYKSTVFPGLWIDVDALFAMNLQRSIEVLHEGISDADHASFIQQLRNSKRSD